MRRPQATRTCRTAANGGYRVDALRPRPDLPGRANRLTGDAPIDATADPAAEPVRARPRRPDRSQGHGRRPPAPTKFAARGRKLIVTLGRADARPATRSGSTSATAATPKPRRGPWGDVGWEELTDGVARRRPAERRADLVPVQRPSGRQGDLPHRGRRPTRRTTVVANGTARSSSAGAASTTTLGVRADASRWPPTWPRVQIGQYERRRLRPSRCRQQAARARRGCKAEVAHDFARQDEMLELLRRAVRRLPVRRLHRRRHRRRPRDPARGAGHVDLRREPRRRRRGNERLIAHELAHQWFGNSLDVARLAAHLAQRGIRLLRRVAVVRALRRRRPPTSSPSAVLAAACGPAAGPRARRPGPGR